MIVTKHFARWIFPLSAHCVCKVRKEKILEDRTDNSPLLSYTCALDSENKDDAIQPVQKEEKGEDCNYLQLE